MRSMLMLFVLAGSAHAQTCVQNQWTPSGEFFAHLAEKYGETSVLTGPTVDGKLQMKLLTSPKGTWTITFTRASVDATCILAVGTDLMIDGDVPMEGGKISWGFR